MYPKQYFNRVMSTFSMILNYTSRLQVYILLPCTQYREICPSPEIPNTSTFSLVSMNGTKFVLNTLICSEPHKLILLKQLMPVFFL